MPLSESDNDRVDVVLSIRRDRTERIESLSFAPDATDDEIAKMYGIVMTSGYVELIELLRGAK